MRNELLSELIPNKNLTIIIRIGYFGKTCKQIKHKVIKRFIVL